MAIAKEKAEKNKKGSDVSTFLSDLNSAIDYRSSTHEDQKHSTHRFCYTIGKQLFLLEKDLKVENIAVKAINHVPNIKEYFEGIISVRGTITPVINLHKFLADKMDIGHTKGTNSHFLLINHKGHKPVVILIDKLPEAINIEAYTSERCTEKMPGWISGILRKENKYINKISHKILLDQLTS